MSWPYRKPPDTPPFEDLPECRECPEALTKKIRDRHLLMTVYEGGRAKVEVRCARCRSKIADLPASQEKVRYSMTHPRQGGLLRGGKYHPASLDNDLPPEEGREGFRNRAERKGLSDAS